MKKSNGSISSEQITKELKGKYNDIKKWKGGDYFKTLVHKTTGDYIVLAGVKGLMSSPTPMLLQKTATMEAIKTWLKENGFPDDTKSIVLKTVLFKII